jgi:outer membrane lipoprotein carrier protein
MRPTQLLSVLAIATVVPIAAAVAHADDSAQGAPAPVAPAAVAPAAVAPLPPAADIVDKVQAFYNQTATFKSDFEQTFLVKAYNMTKKSHGTVVFKKPGMMDWSYVDPAGNRVVSDGTTLNVYEANNKQLYRQPVSASQYPAALSFLTGQGQLSSSFDFELRDGAGPLGFPGGYVLIGTPKVKTAAYQKVLFYVDKATMQIRSVLILDGQNNRNRFDFLNPRVNDPVDANQFVFVPPPDTTVVQP